MSSTSAISGLGITFTASPPLPSSRERDHIKAAYPYHHQHQHHGYHQPYNAPSTQAYQEPQRRMRHSVSYDVGLNRTRWDQGLQHQHEDLNQSVMIRDNSGDSMHPRRVRIAAGAPEVIHDKNPVLVHHHALSPLSDFDSATSSDSHTFSPESMSSLPSSTEEAHPSRPHPYYDPERGRLAKSLGPIAYRGYGVPHEAPSMEAEPSRPYPPSIHQEAVSFLPQPPEQPLQEAPQPRPTASSRLPAFLRERVQARALARPQSMMELGELYAFQAAEQRSRTSNAQGAAGGTKMAYTFSAQSGEQADGEAEDDEDGDVSGDQSPESIPSSAGGLQRRNFERHLREQQQLEREQERQDELGPIQSANERVQRSKSLSQSEAQSAFSDDSSRPRPPSELFALRTQISDAKDADRERSAPVSGPRDALITEDGLDKRRESVFSGLDDSALSRQSTHLTAGANPTRRNKELNRLLSPTKKSAGTLSPVSGSPAMSASSSGVTASTQPRAASHSSSVRPGPIVTSSPVVLEQAKSTSKARVELDLTLETSLVVEGGTLKGRIEINVRRPKERESEVWLGKPKVRVVGFEELSSHDARHIFYHHATSLSTLEGSAAPLPCFEKDSDEEGYQKGVVGQHLVPFSLHLPIGKGAKGGWKGKQGVVRYIVIASMKLKSPKGADRSIAHFYRHVEIFPYLNPAVLLAPSNKPLAATGSKSLFMGGNGKVSLTARVHRASWVAGQRCYVDIRVENESNKKIKTLTLTLLRNTTIFRPRSSTGLNESSNDTQAVQTQTTRKKVAETTLEMGKKVNKGVTAKGSWMGVEAGESADFSHSLEVPTDALSISRGRYLEITYFLKVSAGGSLSADVSCEIPIRVANFVSLDPPPGHCGPTSPTPSQTHSLAKSWSIDQLRPRAQEGAKKQAGTSTMARMASLDSLRLSELNGGRGPSRAGVHALARVPSLETLLTDDLSRGASPAVIDPPTIGTSAPDMLRRFTQPKLGSAGSISGSLLDREQQGAAIIGRAKERQLQHQMSLDCISSVIASATARRQAGGVGHQRTDSVLRTEFTPSSAEVEIWEDEEGGTETGEQLEENPQFYEGGGEQFFSGGKQGGRIELDDLDEVPDDVYRDQTSHRRQNHLDLGDDSEDELDAVLEHTPLENDQDESSPFHAPPPPVVAAEMHSRSTTPSRSPVVRSRPSSPVKAALDTGILPPITSKSALKKKNIEPFVFATASAPLKVAPSPEPPKSPTRRAASGRGPLPAPPSSGMVRSISTRPSSTFPTSSDLTASTAASRARSASTSNPSGTGLRHQPSNSSLKRSPEVAKRGSSRSLKGQALALAKEAAATAAKDGRESDEIHSPTSQTSESSPALPISDNERVPSLTNSPSPSISSASSYGAPSPEIGTEHPSSSQPSGIRSTPSSPRKLAAETGTPSSPGGGPRRLLSSSARPPSHSDLRRAATVSHPSTTSTIPTSTNTSASSGTSLARRTTVVLPSVQSKVAALEVRQSALARLAVGGRGSKLAPGAVGGTLTTLASGGPSSSAELEEEAGRRGKGGLARANSVMSHAGSEVSFSLSMVGGFEDGGEGERESLVGIGRRVVEDGRQGDGFKAPLLQRSATVREMHREI
ncbi:hypothetical protein T439DRAFT_378184 [Meredithblackwellia eburnea MCA 4105]